VRTRRGGIAGDGAGRLSPQFAPFERRRRATRPLSRGSVHIRVTGSYAAITSKFFIVKTKPRSFLVKDSGCEKSGDADLSDAARNSIAGLFLSGDFIIRRGVHDFKSRFCI
jgi:hypothetical protein